MDLAFSCLVWSCEASGKAQTSIESPPEICCFADGAFSPANPHAYTDCKYWLHSYITSTIFPPRYLINSTTAHVSS
jgi:hypothetical protein